MADCPLGDYNWVAVEIGPEGPPITIEPAESPVPEPLPEPSPVPQPVPEPAREPALEPAGTIRPVP